MNIEAILIDNELCYCKNIYEFKRIKYKGSEEFAKAILSNNRLKKLTVFTMSSLLYLQKITISEPSQAYKKIDKAGWEVMAIARAFGYWLCIIMCIIEIIKTLMEGDTKSISKIMMKYALAFASLYFFPWILDFIKEVFA